MRFLTFRLPFVLVALGVLLSSCYDPARFEQRLRLLEGTKDPTPVFLSNLPDLNVQPPEVLAPSANCEGWFATAAVLNSGSVNAPSFNVAVRMKIVRDDTAQAHEVEFSLSFPALPAGQRAEQSVRTTLPRLMVPQPRPGQGWTDYKFMVEVTAEADPPAPGTPFGLIREATEVNNRNQVRRDAHCVI